MSSTNPPSLLAQMLASKGQTPNPATSLQPAPSFRPGLTRLSLFTCPGLNVFHTGPLDLPPLDAPGLSALFSTAQARLAGPGRGPAFTPEQQELLKALVQHKASLYLDKDWHKQMLVALAASGLRLNPELVASRTALLARIKAFETAQSEWLAANGFSSPKAWLAQKAQAQQEKLDRRPKPLTAAEIEAGLLDL